MSDPFTRLPDMADIISKTSPMGVQTETHLLKPGRLADWIVRNSTWLGWAIIALACAVRVYFAASCCLNPDEAQHFDAARPNTLYGVFLASHRLAHPPLFVFLLHFVLLAGRSELWIRLPSLAGGTAALWLTFAWLRRALGALPAFAGLIFLSVSPAAISASTEVRQYGLLLCFICGALYSSQRLFSERSARWATIHGLCLLGALLTHYTATIAIFSIEVYVLCRYLVDRLPRKAFLVLLFTQVVLAAALAWLYFSYVRHAEVFGAQSMAYLNSLYYIPGAESRAHFLSRATTSTFAYLVSQQRAVRSLILAFCLGVVSLVASKRKETMLLALAVGTTFALGYGMALFHIFPFAGSRHQTYLLPFIALSYAALLRTIPARYSVAVLAACLAFAPVWVRWNPPDNNRAIVPIENARETAEYIERTVPTGAPLFVDDETRYVLDYYLGRNDPALDRIGNRSNSALQGHQLISESSFGWALHPIDALQKVDEAANARGIAPRTDLWMVSDPWPFPPLGPQIRSGSARTVRVFGEFSVISSQSE